MKQGLRAFCLGFFPTLCFWGLLAGLGTVWVNTQSVLTPAEQPLVLRSEAPGRYVLEVFSERYEFALPVLPDKPEIFSRYPVLAPRSLRLLAWGWEELSKRMSMSKITEKELAGLEEPLERERSLARQYALYAQLCDDPQLRTKCQELASRHCGHYQGLLELLEPEVGG